MKIVILGLPGSGKSTVGNLLSKALRLPLISLSVELAKISKTETVLGARIRQHWQKCQHSGWEPIPNELAIKALRACKVEGDWILEGFPRNIFQATQIKPDIAYWLDIPVDEAKGRVASRGRQLDTPEIIQKRFEQEEFSDRLCGVLAAYDRKGILRQIKANQSPEEIVHRIQCPPTVQVSLLPEGYWNATSYSTKISIVMDGWRFEAAQEWNAIAHPSGYMITCPSCPFPSLDFPAVSTERGDFVFWDNSIGPDQLIFNEDLPAWWLQNREAIEKFFERKIEQQEARKSSDFSF